MVSDKLGFINWFKGPSEFQKLSEACGTNFALMSFQTAFMVPSSNQKANKGDAWKNDDNFNMSV